MSESKQVAVAEEFLRSRPMVDITGVEISPNPAALTDELHLEVDFSLDRPVAGGVWEIEVTMDAAASIDGHFFSSGGCGRAARAILVCTWLTDGVLSLAVPRRLSDQTPCDQYPFSTL